MQNNHYFVLMYPAWQRQPLCRQGVTVERRPGRLPCPRMIIAALLLSLIGLSDPVVVAAQPAASSVLVLRVNRDGRYQAGLTRALTEFLGQTGATLARTDALRVADRKCDEPECMTRIAEEHGAAVVLAANIDRHGGSERLIRVWLYDVRTGRDQQAKDACNEGELDEHLKSVTGRLINSLSEPKAPDVPEAPEAKEEPPHRGSPPMAEPVLAAPLASPPPAAQFREPDRAAGPKREAGTSLSSLLTPPVRPRTRAWRLGLGASLGVLGALTLGGAIALTVLNGQPTDGACMTPSGQGLLPSCKTGYMPLFAAGYAASGALLLGSVLTFSLR